MTEPEQPPDVDLEFLELLAKAAVGDNAAFATLFDGLYKSLRYESRSLVSNPADAEEILQETALVLWNKICVGTVTATNQRSLNGLAKKILKRQAKDRVWAKRDKIPTPIDLSKIAEWPSNADEIGSAELALALVPIIAQLKFKHRTVLLLYYYAGMPIKEISEVINVKPGTVQSRLARARDEIEELIPEFAIELRQRKPKPSDEPAPHQ